MSLSSILHDAASHRTDGVRSFPGSNDQPVWLKYAYDAPEDLRFRAPGGATRSGRRPSPRASTVWGEGTNYSVIGSEAAFGMKSPEGAIPTDHIAISNTDSAWNLDGDESKTLLARAPIHADEVRELVGRFGRGLDLVTSA